MTPGIELDALVAEKVMGWASPAEGGWLGNEKIRPHQMAWRSREGVTLHSYKETWHPSTDIAAAWDVVEKAGITALIKMEDGRWMARFDEAARNESYYERPTYDPEKEVADYDREYAFGQTPCLAICLAALKAISAST